MRSRVRDSLAYCAWQTLRGGIIAGILTATACRDLPTAPSLVAPPRPRLRDLTTDPKWGRNASPANGSWDGVVSAWDGGTPFGDPWYFPYKTFIVVNISGDVTQGDGALKGSGQVVGPTGYTNLNGLFGAVGYRVASSTGSSMWWPQANKTTDTVAVRYEMRPIRGAWDGAQPRDDNPASCGRNNNQTPQWACYTYSGAAHLSFTRLHMDLTLSPIADTTVDQEASLTFTAGATPATLNGNAVDVSEVTWRWESEQPFAGDTAACMSQTDVLPNAGPVRL